MSIVWSFSSLKTFQQCPKKYYHTKIAKDIVEPDTQATLYGKTAHTVAEEYIRDGVPIPEQFAYMQATLDVLKEIPGEKLCEVKLGLTKNLESCDFDAPNVWWHGVADLVIINRTTGTAHSIDYKTSKEVGSLVCSQQGIREGYSPFGDDAKVHRTRRPRRSKN